MNRKTVFAVTGLLMLASAPTAFADRGDMYFGVDALSWTYTQGSNSGGATGIRGVFGQQFTDILGWEVQLGTGGTASIPGLGTGSIELNGMGGGYLRVGIPLGIAELHALAGLGFASYSSGSQLVYRSDASYGFGAQISVGKRAALRADYMQYISGGVSDTKAVTFGGTFYL